VVRDLRDGLTASQRSVLRRLGSTDARSGRLELSARVVAGGDESYAAAIALAQPWTTRYPLLHGAGNLGSDEGDAPADPQYTELGLTPLGEAVLDGPVPTFFVNGPPHNLGEIAAGLLALIEDPVLDLHGLMAHVPGPDLPTGGVIVDAEPIREAYATGRGVLPMRPRFRVEQDASGRVSLVIDETPYGVGRSDFLRSIVEAVADRRVRGLVDLHHATGSPAVMTIAATMELDEILDQLDEHTAMRTLFELNIEALVDDAPTTLPLLDAMRMWIDRVRTAGLVDRLRALADRFGDERRTEIS